MRRARGEASDHTVVMRKIPVYYYSSSSNLTGRFAEALARIDGRRVLNLARSDVRRGEPSGPWVLLPAAGNHGLWIAFLAFMLARGVGLGLLLPGLLRRLPR